MMAELLDVAFFVALRETSPLQLRLSWEEFTERLSQHREQPIKDGPGFSAALYRAGMTRGNDGVESLSAAVVDVDHAEPMWDLLNDLEYVAFTSYSHGGGEKCNGRADCPHWRIVIPFTRSVPRDNWTDLRARVKFWLVPNADDGAKDAARFNYLPACKAGAPRETRRGKGTFLDPDSLSPVPVQPSAAPSGRTNGHVARPANGEERPGDRFNRTADWAEVLTKHGWRYGGSSGDTTYWIRPGKRDAGHSATSGGGGHDVLYVFSSEAAPFDPDTSYTKFRAYSILNHGGDDTAAARKLAEDFGMTSPKATGKRVRPVSSEEQAADDEVIEVPGRPCTQLGNAERLMDQYGDQLRYCYAWKTWLWWDGRRWKQDDSGQAAAWAQMVVRNINREAADAETPSQRNALRAWARTCEKSAQVDAMLVMARPHAAISIEQLDLNPWLLNVRNGTVDLRTGELREHHQEDFITKLIDQDYSPDAECPRWNAVLERVLPDEEIRAFLQRAAGYSATGSVRERKLIIMHGSGRNGKSLVLETLLRVLEEYADRTRSETLMVQNHGAIPTGIAELRGARFIYASETQDGSRLAESVVKELTGGESLKGRFLFSNSFTFIPTHTPWMATNHRPVVRGTDDGIWDRLALVPFEVRISDDEQDLQLLEKLREEYAGILAWIVRGALAWYAHGLALPSAVSTATQSYKASMDTVGLFLAECCVQEPGNPSCWATSAVLYVTYVNWCEAGKERPMSKRALGIRLGELGFTQALVGPSRSRGWVGVRIASDTENLEL